jgi:hypothetical protein
VLIPVVIHQDEWLASMLGMERGLFVAICLGSILCLSVGWLPHFQVPVEGKKMLARV